MPALATLDLAAVLGFAGYYGTCLVRSLPWFRGPVLRGAKPWACDICMAFWMTVAVAIFEMILTNQRINPCAFFGGVGVCCGLLRWHGHMTPPAPPAFPSDEKGVAPSCLD